MRENLITFTIIRKYIDYHELLNRREYRKLEVFVEFQLSILDRNYLDLNYFLERRFLCNIILDISVFI